MLSHEDGRVNKIKANDVELAVVILAQDEADYLRETLVRLKAVQGPRDKIHVVADHCSDSTSTVARNAGASVHVRRDGGLPGKGPAIHWWLQRTTKNASPDQIILVLDADSRVSEGFFQTLRYAFAQGAKVVQARVAPILTSGETIQRLAAFSEQVEQLTLDSLRSFLGWPTRLRGTGMAFRRSVLEGFSSLLRTKVEDVELSLLLAAEKVDVSVVPSLEVRDPKPSGKKGVVHQRARWLQGQVQVIRAYPRQILRVLKRGPAGWSLLSSILLKPKSFFIPLKVVLAIWGSLLFSKPTTVSWLGGILAGFCVLSLLIDGMVYLITLRNVREKRATLSSLIRFPIYVLLWTFSLTIAILSREPWLRSRPRMIPRTTREIGSARWG